MYANASAKSNNGRKNNDLTEIIAQVLSEMKMEQGENFDPEKVNIVELERRTGISRVNCAGLKQLGLWTFHMPLEMQSRENASYRFYRHYKFSSLQRRHQFLPML